MVAHQLLGCKPFQGQRHTPRRHRACVSERRHALAHAWLRNTHAHRVERVHRFAASATDVSSPATAKEAVESGLEAYKKANYDEAVKMFFKATQLSPSKEEALAANYNLACAYTKQRQWAQAADAVAVAVNDFGLKVTVPLQDPDLKTLRERREWIDKLPELKGSLSSSAKVDLRSEIKSPYRFPRQFIFGGLGASAFLGLLVITTRLVKAVQGGEGAPDLPDTIQNFAINLVAVGAFGWLFARDLKAKERDMKVVLREEDLGRLQVEINPQRVIPLIKFRGVARPVILCGSKSYVERAIKAAEPYMIDLKSRGVSVIPVILTSADEVSDADRLRALKEQFQMEKKTGFGSLATSKDKDTTSSKSSVAEAGLSEKELKQRMDQPELEVVIKERERRFRYKPFDVPEWKLWMDEQKDFAKLSTSEQNCYIQVQLDGRVRSSGLGLPPWSRFVGDLPPLDSIRTSFTDGTISDI